MTGRVRMWNDAKGYGFISTPEHGRDVFVHASAIVGTGRKSLTMGALVQFDVVDGPKGKQATTVTLLGGIAEDEVPPEDNTIGWGGEWPGKQRRRRE